MNPENIVNEIRSGKRTDYQTSKAHEALLICEQALGAGEAAIAQMFYTRLSEIEQQIYHFRVAQLDNDAALAQQHLTSALQISRSREHRDHLLEARIRMEWGILRASIGEHEQAGVDLRWAMERLGAISDGHRWHGLCIINMAKWHQNRGELGMALAMHSEISRNGPHHVEIIAISRRNAAELLVAKNHNHSALRNLWIAHHGFRQTGMVEAAIESGLHWIDLGIGNITPNAQRMDDAVNNAKPRSVGDPLPEATVSPDDVMIMIEWMEGQELDEVGQSLLTEAQELVQL
ncbi:MAG: hypothetical protein VYA86_01215 [Candidatus Thermoplasmatota archaeon]|nr:hypothetical protein [Candidatus Thermoplasmatota archaeon]